jgi:NAD(P)-dependent dehydrogenase (short-subunit alcohol dehydrogenase family)
MDLKEKIIFIAGASGMAAATARLALSRGARIFSVDKNPEAATALASELSAHKGSIHTYYANLAEESSVAAAFEECLKVFGGFDAVFHAIGISGRRFGDGALHECTLNGWEVTQANNATSAFLVSRSALRYFVGREPVAPTNLRGTILNMTSVLAYSPQKDYFATHAYAASKGAIISMTRSAAAYYAPLKININAIAPGLVASPMSIRAQQDKSIIDFIKHKQPLTETFLSQDEIAQAAVFLLSDAAKNITGQVLAIDGGWTVSE